MGAVFNKSLLSDSSNVNECRGVVHVVFVAHVDAYYSAFIGLATSIGRTRSFSPKILFPRLYPNVFKHMDDCIAKGVAFKATFDSAAGQTPGTSLRRLAALATRGALAVVRRLPGGGCIVKLISLKARMRAIRNELFELSPSVIILGGDIVGHDMALYIRVGHNLGIPSAVLPGWMASAREPAELQLYNPDYSLRSPLNWIFCRFFPRWRFDHKGRALIRLPAQEALALEMMHLAPPLPWTLHSGFADVIGVESEEARWYGLREGLDPQRLVVTGSHIHDVLYAGMMERNERRAAIYERFGLNPDRPLVVCALPPDMLYGTGGRPECEFSDYSALVASFLEPIHLQLGASFIVCPHPSANRDQLSFVAKYGAILAEETVAELLPLADLYVASISATIQWAVACSVPVINYDVYCYRYTDYISLLGVLTIETKKAYVDALARMIDEPFFRAARSDDQRFVAERWGVLDGKATERICNILHNLVIHLACSDSCETSCQSGSSNE